MRKGFTCSAFDLLHAGHIEMLKDARNQCDYLIVGLQTDPTMDRPEKNQPVQNVSERYIQLDALSCVDEIIPYATEAELLNLIKMIDPYVRILGEEYKDKDFTGRDFCENEGVNLYYNKRKHDYSTSDLRRRVVEND
jgi:glycerol-3-phosphate cytidylyltransferase